MRKTFKIILLLAVVATTACRQLNPFSEGEVIARVGDKRLYLSDVAVLHQDGLTPQDSLMILESYVDQWVRTQLKVQEAERLFSANSSDIDAMVEDYRNSLLSHRLDQYYVDNRLDTLYTEEEINAYYEEHKADFVLDRPIVKGVIVKLPSRYNQQANLKTLMAGTGDRYHDFLDISTKNNFQVTEFDTWTDFGDFISSLPASRTQNYEDLLRQNGVQEMRDGNDVYFFLIRESLAVGDISPLERVEEMIKRIIFVQRRQEVIRAYEDSIYSAGMNDKLVEIKIKPQT